MNSGVLLLAAGRSRRFGSDKRHATLADGSTLLDTCIRRIEVSGLPLLVCVGLQDRLLAGELEARGVPCLPCRDAALGMGNTLAEGIHHVAATWDAAIIALADMPWVHTTTYLALARNLSRKSIAVPRYRGAHGNPVGFGADYFPRLRALEGDRGARALLCEHADAIRFVDVDDAGVTRDVDTPQMLARSQDCV